MRRAVACLGLAAAFAGACDMKDPPEQFGGTTGSGVKSPPVELVAEKMPDAAWSEAARSATQQWQDAFIKANIRRVTMSPLVSPDGTMVPYLMRAKAFDYRGMVASDQSALVHDGKLLNGGGKAAAERFFAAIKYPQNQIPLGHLVEILGATGTVEATWIRPPTKYGWDFTTLQGATRHVPASVIYDDMGSATLTLMRDGKRAPKEKPKLERLEIKIGHDGSLTITGP